MKTMRSIAVNGLENTIAIRKTHVPFYMNTKCLVFGVLASEGDTINGTVSSSLESVGESMTDFLWLASVHKSVH